MDYARHRVTLNGLPFNLKPEDFEMPTICPVLGIPLVLGQGKLHDNSPTLDRIIPELGYVKGNVKVISYKANRIKNNGTLADLEAVIRYMKQDNTEERLSEKWTESVTTNTLEGSTPNIESELYSDVESETEMISPALKSA